MKKSAIEKSKGSAIKNIPPFKIFKNLLFPIPPLEEQKRIIKRIKEILPLIEKYGGLVDELEYMILDSFSENIRKSILQEAIQGKLTEHNPEDEPASLLLEKIRKEKEKLIKEKKIKRNKNESVIYKENGSYYEKIGKEVKCIDDEIPFEIPNTWEFCRMESAIQLISGRDMKKENYNDKNEGIPYITGASNIKNDEIIINRWTKTPITVAHKGDLLLTCKGTIGKLIILRESEVHIARQIMSIRTSNNLNSSYLKYFLEAYVSKLKNIAKSMIPGISRDNILSIIFPIPPLNEQYKITEKLEEVLPLIEKYGKLVDELECI